MLVERQIGAAGRSTGGLQSAGSADDKIVVIGRQLIAKFAIQRQRDRAVCPQCGRKLIAIRAKGKQAFEFMVAIVAPGADVEREIDLGICGFGEHGGALAGKVGFVRYDNQCLLFHIVTLNLVQGPASDLIRRTARWMLKQVQHDEVRIWHGQSAVGR